MHPNHAQAESNTKEKNQREASTGGGAIWRYDIGCVFDLKERTAWRAFNRKRGKQLMLDNKSEQN